MKKGLSLMGALKVMPVKLYADRDGNIIRPGMILETNNGTHEKVIRLVDSNLGFYQTDSYGATLDKCYIMPTPTETILMDYRIVES